LFANNNVVALGVSDMMLALSENTMIFGFEGKVNLLCKRLVNYCNSLALYCTCMLLIFVIVCDARFPVAIRASTPLFHPSATFVTVCRLDFVMAITDITII
jgi:hypothetical protein